MLDKAREPIRFLDRDLIATRLRLRRDELALTLNDPGFPAPSGYFRGRLLWDEQAVEAWNAGARGAAPASIHVASA